MKFLNSGADMKIRLDEDGKSRWVTIKHGEVLELPDVIASNNGLVPFDLIEKIEKPEVTVGELNDKPVETKQIETEKVVEKKKTEEKEFYDEIRKIKGIGVKTAKDIVTWGSKHKLLEKIRLKEKLPFRDDVAKLLETHYG